ncbi:MAG: tyrosine-type recombinase/integrase [Cyanobacteria bacterium HKST-UBA01]|nr:tyrosine-type recombinase/integrase [Cyanobacteria bacterium HKST-UBA01]
MKQIEEIENGVQEKESKVSPYIPTIREALEKYCEIRRLNPKSAREYRNRAKRGIPDWLDMRLDEVNGYMVEQRHKELTIESGPSAADYTMQTLSAVFSWACGYWLNEEGRPIELWNPVSRLSNIRAWHGPQSRKDQYLRDDQLGPWWMAVQAMENIHYRDLLIFLLMTGCRISEGMALRWQDIDFDTKTFRLATTKNGKPHTLPMSKYLTELIESRYRHFRHSTYVFQGRTTKRPIASIYYATNAVAKKVGFNIPPHGLRRTFANIATHPKVNASALIIKTLLNHTDPDVTSKHYVSPHIEALRPVVEAISLYILHEVNHPRVRQLTDESAKHFGSVTISS